MTKYATYTKYKPYIDVIMKDLDLTDKVIIDWKFGTWRTKGGSARLDHYQIDGKRTGKVNVEIHQGHAYTLKILMHELMHIKQYYDDRLTPSFLKKVIGKRGKVSYEWFVKWKGVDMPLITTSKNPLLQRAYLTQPWEVEAYDYMDKDVGRLFPKNKLPVETKKYVGSVGNVKFYRMVKG